MNVPTPPNPLSLPEEFTPNYRQIVPQENLTSRGLPPAETADAVDGDSTFEALVGETPYFPALRAPRPALSETIEKLPRSWRHQIHRASDLLRQRRQAPARPALPTTEPLLDRMLGGGLPRGQLVELVGRRSSGRFALVLTILAATTLVGEAAVLIDLGDSFDPRLAQKTGCDLPRLLWLRPPRLKEALLSAEAVVQGGFPLVIVDLGNPPVPGGRGVESSWLRLARAARDQGTALLISAPYRVSGTAAAAVVGANGGRAQWQGKHPGHRLLLGLESRLIPRKLRSSQFEMNAGSRQQQETDHRLRWRVAAAPPLPHPSAHRNGSEQRPRPVALRQLAAAGR